MATLSQLLSLPELGLRLVQSGPGDPELSWVSTTELLDLGDYLEGGEIVLTTGLALSAEDERWRDFVAGLSRARAAAIGFGIGVNHERIPAPLRAAASTYQVALVEVPPPTPFIAVSKAVAGLLRADELHAAQRALQIHQRLLDGAQGPQNTADVLASMAQATGRQLAVIGPDHRSIASTAGFAAAAGDAIAEGRAEVVPLDNSRGEGSTAPAGTRLVIAGDNPLGPEERAVIAAGAMVLGLEVRGARGGEERERERWARLTLGLLTGKAHRRAAWVLDPETELPEQIRAIAVQGPAEDVAAWRRTPRTGLDRLVTAGRPGAPGVSLAWQLCAATEGPVWAAIEQATQRGLDVVIGRAADLVDAPLSRRSAAARLSALSTVSQLYVAPRTPAVVWADRAAPVLEALLGADANDVHDPAGVARAVLGPLCAMSGGEVGADVDPSPREPLLPAEDRTALRETLRTLLAHNGQRGPAAAKLGVHRNTLRDRVARIERLTGRSIDHPDDRAELWLALRIEESSRR